MIVMNIQPKFVILCKETTIWHWPAANCRRGRAYTMV